MTGLALGTLMSGFFTLNTENYHQFVANYNHQSWPLQISALIICLWLLWLLHQQNRSITISRVIAACWIWVGSYFHYHFYISLSPLAKLYALLFVIQGFLFILLSSTLRFQQPYVHRYSKIGYAGLAACMLLPTFAASFSGQSWWHIPLLGMMPTPTAIATLALLLLTDSRSRWLLAMIPFVWCMIAGITSYNANMTWWYIAPVTACAAVLLLLAERRRTVFTQ